MSISPMKFGAKGNGSTDDHKAVQAAIDKASNIQWCDGSFRSFAVSQPIVLRPSIRLRQLTLRALPSFPSGKAILNTAQKLQKVVLDDVVVEGAPGVNGLDASLQQQSELRRFRANNCAVGYRLDGQQALHFNMEFVNCGKGVLLDGAWFMWFFGTNIEGSNVGVELPDAHNCAFWGLHMETNGTSIHFPPDAGTRAVVFDTVHMPAGNSVVCESDKTNYEIRNWMPQGSNESTLIVDKARGYTVTNGEWGDGFGWESNFVQRRGQVPPLMQVRDAA